MGKGLDLVGQRFESLEVIALLPERQGGNRIWLCMCDCGTPCKYPTRALRGGLVVSCGCNGRKKRTANLQTMPTRTKLGQVDGTNLSRLASQKVQKNNKSGRRGVSWNAGVHLWIAFIHVSGKRIHLGSSKVFAEAVKMREEGERLYHQPLMERHQWDKRVEERKANRSVWRPAKKEEETSSD